MELAIFGQSPWSKNY